MSEQTFINNGEGEVEVQVEIIDTTVQVDSALAAIISAEVDFNTQFLLLTFTQDGIESSWEIVKATGIAGQIVTIERAQEGTSAAVWVVNSVVAARWTDGSAIRARNQIFRLLYNAQGELLLDAGNDLLIGEEV